MQSETHLPLPEEIELLADGPDFVDIACPHCNGMGNCPVCGDDGALTVLLAPTGDC